jgi:thiazole/oxazole-forming peptide maturase SagD family component
LYDRMVSPLCGPLIDVKSLMADAAEPRIWRTVAQGSTVDRRHANRQPFIGEGQGSSPTSSLERCLMEAVERLGLREPVVGPDVAHAGDPTGCLLERKHLTGLRLESGTMTTVSAADVYLHPPDCAFLQRAARPTSNGAAAGWDLWGAAERAVFELLERDAVMVTWRTRLTWPRLTPSLSPACEQLFRMLMGLGIRGHLIDMSALHRVPIVGCVLAGRVRGRPIVGFGSAAARCTEAASIRAIRESSAAYSIVAHRLLSGRRPPDIDAVQDFEDNALYYLDPERQQHLSFLIDGPLVTDAGAAIQSDVASIELVHRIGSSLADGGLRVTIVDITPAAFRRRGPHAVKALSRDLVPLEIGAPGQELHPRLLAGSVPPERINREPVPLA